MIKKLLLISLLSFSLQGCFFVAGAAAGAAVVGVVYDHRKFENILEDQNISNAVVNRISTDASLSDKVHVDVTAFNHIVLLTGEAPTADMRQQVENIAHSTQGVSKVYNEITVQGPTSTLTRTSDSWITTKIKSQMLATKDLKSGTIKVVTENGSVYLMGIVSHAQADMAVDIARQVAGVQRVVKIFQYTD